MRDRERANRGGRADGRLVRLGRRRRRGDGRKGPQRGFFLDRRGSCRTARRRRFGRRRRQLGFFSFRRCSRRRGSSSAGARMCRSGWWHDGRRRRQRGLYSGWRHVVSGGRAAGAAVDSLASTLIGAAATGGAAAGQRWLVHRRERHAAPARLAQPLRARRLRAPPRPSNRRGRADGCIVLGEGGRAYRAERDKPGRQRRGYRGPHRRHGGRQIRR